MSIWSLEEFDINAALGFLDRANDLEPVRESLRALTEAEPSVMLAEALVRETLVAAETVAFLHELPPVDLPDAAARRMARLVDDNPVTAADAVLAYNAVARLRGRSELSLIWEEREATRWFAAIDDLLARLEQIATPGGEGG